MYSIQTQNREIIYYRPNVKKFYLLEKDRDEKITYEIRATIDDNDRLLGVYSKKSEAQNIMMEMISDNFWTNAPVYCMPEDKQ
ncbi:hypothetical protein [uncultured Solobacterium sp.]|uniref:hypothetical protein n=1 Tax=uncultured Solobacterium sp. TaxID=747375 RepID=UPI002623624A|nr:hypothetical protein [uncultured Solobacterium sp.]